MIGQGAVNSMKFGTLVLALSVGMSAAAADDDPIDEIGAWSIYRNATNCAAFSAFADEEFVGIYYDASDRSTWIVFTDVDATSLDDGDARTIDIYLERADGSIDDGWEGVEFTLGVGGDGRRLFVSQDLDEPALSDFKKARTIGFFYKDRKIAAYDLAGTAAALGAVERCSMGVHGINPRDVFAGED